MPILFVLESPGKVKNVQKYIGDDYIVASSVGHIRTLGSEHELGIDIDKKFTPTYLIDPKKSDVVSKLKSLARKSDMVYLAADWDREGEAIAWHIKETLGLADGEYKRIVFRQITQPAILAALENPVDLDMNMVNSQQARMILDKLIGYKVSPCLWKEFKNYKLSAGRVQSVAVRMIVEREQEIAAFTASTFYRPLATFSINKDKINPKRPDIRAECDDDIKDVNEVSNIINNTDSGLAIYRIADLKESKTKRRAPAPFITSSLQQEASNKLGMSPDACMAAAQKLYEAGLITYMRTDSYVLSPDALRNIGDYIKTTYGTEYHSQQQHTKKAKGAQEAHEAIRPTDVKTTSSGSKVGPREGRLYQMIWRRTVACQMSPADVEIKSVKIAMDTTKCNPKVTSRPTFTAKCEKILFDGYLRVYTYGADGVDTTVDTTSVGEATSDDKEPTGKGEAEEGVEPSAVAADETTDESAASTGTASKRLEALFAKLEVGQQVWCAGMLAEERQTRPPNGRFTEASLIKKLEDAKIGRPSTYASIVTKIKDKLYVERKTLEAVPKEFRRLEFMYPNKLEVTSETRKVNGEKNKLFPTGLGTMICGYLTKNFAQLMDYTFTADVEEKLDNIASGSVDWHAVVGTVWNYLYPIIDELGSMLAGTRGQGRRVLGCHPDSGHEICVVKTRFGWTICEENPDDKKQSRWASLGTRDPDSMDLEGALAILVWPKQLGEYKDHPVELCRAKSIYVKYNGKNYSIDIYNSNIGKSDKPINPETASLEDAIQVITTASSSGSDAKPVELSFECDANYKILNGRYGYYIKYMDTHNVPLSYAHKKDISKLTKADVETAIKKYLSKSDGGTSAKPATAAKGKKETKAPTTETKAKKATKPATSAVVKVIKEPVTYVASSSTEPVTSAVSSSTEPVTKPRGRAAKSATPTEQDAKPTAAAKRKPKAK